VNSLNVSVLFFVFGLMMVQWAETCRLIFNIDYQYMLCYWLNKLLCIIITIHNGMAPIEAEERASGNLWLGRWAIACCRGEKKTVLFLVGIGRRFLGHQIPRLVTTATELAGIRFNIALPILTILIFPCPK